MQIFPFCWYWVVRPWLKNGKCTCHDDSHVSMVYVSQNHWRIMACIWGDCGEGHARLILHIQTPVWMFTCLYDQPKCSHYFTSVLRVAVYNEVFVYFSGSQLLRVCQSSCITSKYYYNKMTFWEGCCMQIFLNVSIVFICKHMIMVLGIVNIGSYFCSNKLTFTLFLMGTFVLQYKFSS